MEVSKKLYENYYFIFIIAFKIWDHKTLGFLVKIKKGKPQMGYQLGQCKQKRKEKTFP